MDGVLSAYQNTGALQVQYKFEDAENEAKILYDVMTNDGGVEVWSDTHGFFPYFRFMDKTVTELKITRKETNKSAQTHRCMMLKGVVTRSSEIEGDEAANRTLL